MIQYVQNSETDPILKGKHLTSAQQQRQFDFSRVPKDDSLEDWVDGTMSDMEGKHFCSQDAVDYYIDGFMSSDEQ